MTTDEYQPTLPQGDHAGPVSSGESELEKSQLGQRLLDRYEVFRVRQGGFGIVYFVTDTKTSQEYAVKTYRQEFASLLNTEQFLAEVDFWMRLEPHPNIVRAHFVEQIQGQPHLFMEYVGEGTMNSLRDRILRGKLDRDQAIGIAYQLCLAMEFVNQKTEVVHGDLKPENILIDGNGVVKVTDFGLAHRLQISDGQYPRLKMGSWPYASPERFRNEVEDSRSDMYSFGVIFHELLTGELPYPFRLSRSPQDLEAQLSHFHARRGGHDLCQEFYYGSRPDPSNGILLKCLDDQAERFINFSGLRRSLEKRFSLDPAKYQVHPKSSETHGHQRALALHRIGHFSEALSLYNTLLQQHPDEAILWFDAAQSLLAIGQMATAESFLNRAQDLDPEIDQKRNGRPD